MKVTEEIRAQARTDWDRNATRIGLTIGESILGKTFTIKKHSFTIIGLHHRIRKCPIMTERYDGALRTFTKDAVIELLKNTPQ